MLQKNAFLSKLVYVVGLIGQKELVKIAVEIEISVFMAILSCF